MILGSLPFVLYLQAVRGGAKRLWRDTQVRWFMGILLVSLLALSGWLWLSSGMAVDNAVRYAAFNATSILTGTGYSSADFGSWGSFALPVFTVLMFIGGCTGGTTGGIKVIRFQVLYATARVQIHQLIQPHGVFPMKYNYRPIPETVPGAVMGFFFLFVVSVAVLAMALSLMGLDYITSISGAATALANVGPGLGPIRSVGDARDGHIGAGLLHHRVLQRVLQERKEAIDLGTGFRIQKVAQWTAVNLIGEKFPLVHQVAFDDDKSVQASLEL